jgi:hypothetical protein
MAYSITLSLSSVIPTLGHLSVLYFVLIDEVVYKIYHFKFRFYRSRIYIIVLLTYLHVHNKIYPIYIKYSVSS